MEVRISKKVFNDIYLPYLNTDNRYEIIYGGAGSGKSVFMAQKKIYLNMRDKGRNTLVVRKVGKTNRYSTFALFNQIISDWNLYPIFDINKTDMTITNKYNKNQIRFAGLDDVEKLKSITFESGILTDIWIEEASEANVNDFRVLDTRLRGSNKYNVPFQINLTFNPVSQLSWLKSQFFDNTNQDFRKKVSILKSTYLDNKFIDNDYKEMLEALKDEDFNFYRIYCLGEWGTFQNIILSNWEVKELSLTNIWKDYDYITYGLDFGYNHPSVMVLVGIKDGDVYVLDELYKRRLTNAELICEAEKFVVDRNISIVADSAEPDRIREFRNNGFLSIRPAEKGKNSVKMGIDYLRGRKIYINTRCVNTLKEIQNWQYKVDKEGNVTEEPVAFNDDAIAAIRYATEQFWGSKSGLGFVKLR
jgi:phage terminase large subunit